MKKLGQCGFSPVHQGKRAIHRGHCEEKMLHTRENQEYSIKLHPSPNWLFYMFWHLDSYFENNSFRNKPKLVLGHIYYIYDPRVRNTYSS